MPRNIFQNTRVLLPRECPPAASRSPIPGGAAGDSSRPWLRSGASRADVRLCVRWIAVATRRGGTSTTTGPMRQRVEAPHSVSPRPTPPDSKAPERLVGILPAVTRRGRLVADGVGDIGRRASRQTCLSVAATGCQPGGEADAHRARTYALRKVAVPTGTVWRVTEPFEFARWSGAIDSRSVGSPGGAPRLQRLRYGRDRPERRSLSIPITQRPETPVGRSRRGTGFAAVSSLKLSRRLDPLVSGAFSGGVG
jgi:hypothetical protein